MPERTVSEFLHSQVKTIDMESNGIAIAVFLCEVIDSQGRRCHCDGFEVTHRHFDEVYGVTVTPLDTWVEWRD